MALVVKTRLVKIGSSRGIRIPKVLLDQLGPGEEVELEAQPDRIVIRRARQARRGWDEQFRAMAERGDDRLLDVPEGPLTTWDADEWEW